MLHESSVLRAAGGRLVAIQASAATALNEIFPIARRGDTAVGTKGIAVPLRARDGEHYVAHVLPLTSGARRRAATSYAAVAALFVHKAEMEAPSLPEAIAKVYNLTPSELRVLLAIVQVGGVPETAGRSAWPRRPSRRTCTACSARPAPAARPTSSSWWPGLPALS